MRQELFKRLGFGTLCGLAGMAPLGVLFPYTQHSALTALCGGSVQLAGLARLAAGAAWGAAVCAGALLWRRERGTFLTSSLWNYLLDGGAFVLWVWVCFGFQPQYPLVLGGAFTGLYLIGWAVRWLTCRRDVDAIREKLGLSLPPAAPSPLRWRESLPYLLLAAALFLGLRPALTPLDGADVPLLTGLFLPWLAFPFIAAVTGFGAGLRHGLCPLLPAAVLLAFLPNLLYRTVPYCWPQAAVYTLLTLGGNLLGMAWSRWKIKIC